MIANYNHQEDEFDDTPKHAALFKDGELETLDAMISEIQNPVVRQALESYIGYRIVHITRKEVL